MNVLMQIHVNRYVLINLAASNVNVELAMSCYQMANGVRVRLANHILGATLSLEQIVKVFHKRDEHTIYLRR